MWLKKIPLLLLACLISIASFADDPPKLGADGLPTLDYSKLLMENNPNLVWEMIKKLYVIEHSTPSLSLPLLKIIETKDDRTIIGYSESDTVSVILGYDPYKITYLFTVKPAVTLGVKTKDTLPIWLYVVLPVASVVCFGTGFVAGRLLR